TLHAHRRTPGVYPRVGSALAVRTRRDADHVRRRRLAFVPQESSPMSDPVDSAVNTIRDNLDQGFWDWDVSHGDLAENNSTLADLTPAQRNEVISRLSDGDLDTWADEINGSLGELSAGERQDLFNSLAQGLDAEQLARVTRAFEGHDGSIAELGR